MSEKDELSAVIENILNGLPIDFNGFTTPGDKTYYDLEGLAASRRKHEQRNPLKTL